MKKDIKNSPLTCNIAAPSTEEQLESLLDCYNFEKMESCRIASEMVTSFGWLIFAFCCLNVIKRWLFLKD